MMGWHNDLSVKFLLKGFYHSFVESHTTMEYYGKLDVLSCAYVVKVVSHQRLT
jgi:hypothetical protein